jgi:NADH/F420H2 dehydrogenase subunit C
MKNLLKIKSLVKSIPFLVYQEFNNEICLVVSKNTLLFVLNFLRLHIGSQYKLLSCISGVDFLTKNYRFSVVYDLLSLTYNSRLRLKVFTNELQSLPSSVKIFINANWWEREIWDLYGIYFDQHPDLRRILTDYGFEGHPLRKDFPLSGYIEVRYDDNKKRIVVEPLELTQEARSFTFESPWI